MAARFPPGQNTIDPAGRFQYTGSRNLNDWYPQLVDDPAFMDRVRARWRELRRGLLSDAALEQRVATLSAPLSARAQAGIPVVLAPVSCRQRWLLNHSRIRLPESALNSWLHWWPRGRPAVPSNGSMSKKV